MDYDLIRNSLDCIDIIEKEPIETDIDYYIRILIKFITNLGFRVQRDTYIANDFIGQCDYKDYLISIAPITGKDALLTLAHEIGHAVSHLRLKHYGINYSSYKRELLAYLYGWTVLRWVGATTILSKHEWKKFHALEIEAYKIHHKYV